MKKLLYLVALLALPPLSIAQTELKFNADIRGRSCSGGLGICSVLGTSEVKKDNQNYKTTASKIDATTFVLDFNKTMLSEAEQKSLLNTTLSKITTSQAIEFTQEEDLLLDSHTLQLLEIEPKYNTIRKGKYPIVIGNDSIKITFTLWEH